MTIETIKGYHAHVYFDAATADKARALQQRISDNFEISMGRFHEKNVGPHPRWSYQVAFKAALFDTLIPWLMLNRDGLTVFVHGLSGDDLFDHTALTLWLGESVPLNLEIFR